MLSFPKNDGLRLDLILATGRWPAGARRRRSIATSARASLRPTTPPSWPPSRRDSTAALRPEPRGGRRSPWSGAGAAGLMAAIWAARTSAPDTRVRRPRRGARCWARRSSSPAAGGATSRITRWTRRRSTARRRPRSARCCAASTSRARSLSSASSAWSSSGRRRASSFPVTDRARTVLDALLTATRQAGVDAASSVPCRPASTAKATGSCSRPRPGRPCAPRASCSRPEAAACPRRAPTAAATRWRSRWVIR